jgi:hypothetical protein
VLSIDRHLLAYVAEHSSGISLTVRGATDPDAAAAALDRGGTGLWAFPQLDGSLACAFMHDRDGERVLFIDLRDLGTAAGLVVTRLLAQLDAEGIDGRLEPWERPPHRSLPFEYDPMAHIYGPSDAVLLEELDDRGLPPGFPSGLPVPDHATMVIAQRGARPRPWGYAAWRRFATAVPPFDAYLHRLHTVADEVLAGVASSDDAIPPHRFRHQGSTGTVSVHHELLPKRDNGEPRVPPLVWYLGIRWTPS